MPFKSDAQRKYMNWAASKGKIKTSIVDEFNKASKELELPETVDKVKKVRRAALMRLGSKNVY